MLTDELHKHFRRDLDKVSAGCWVEVAPQILSPSPLLSNSWDIEMSVFDIGVEFCLRVRETALDEPCHPNLDKFLGVVRVDFA